jgi:hypothetical protein
MSRRGADKQILFLPLRRRKVRFLTLNIDPAACRLLQTVCKIRSDPGIRIQIANPTTRNPLPGPMTQKRNRVMTAKRKLDQKQSL